MINVHKEEREGGVIGKDFDYKENDFFNVNTPLYNEEKVEKEKIETIPKNTNDKNNSKNNSETEKIKLDNKDNKDNDNNKKYIPKNVLNLQGENTNVKNKKKGKKRIIKELIIDFPKACKKSPLSTILLSTEDIITTFPFVIFKKGTAKLRKCKLDLTLIFIFLSKLSVLHVRMSPLKYFP